MKGWHLLAALTIAAIVARGSLITCGPDLDPDAYAHVMAGRKLLVNWRDVDLHWVWLPLPHAWAALVTWLGGTMEHLRWANAVLSCATAWLLALDLRSHAATLERPDEVDRVVWRAIPWLAGALLLADPLLMQLGTTAQTEPLFAFAVLAASVAWRRSHHVLVGIALSAAVMTRYEAWVLIPVVAGSWLLQRPIRFRTSPGWLLPGSVVALWIAVHGIATGEWLQFLRLNREFAFEYLSGVGYPWGAKPSIWRMAIWYPAMVPWRDMLGWVHVLALPGAVWLLRRGPRPYLIVAVCLLAFVTAGWLGSQHLGLARHAVSLAPFYALFVAGSLGWCAQARSSPWLRRRAAAVVTTASVLVFSLVLPRTVARHRALAWACANQPRSHEAAARVLRKLDPPLVFCDRAHVEIHSALPPARFVRWQVRDVSAYRVQQEAESHGEVAIVTHPEQTHHLPPPARRAYADDEVVVWVYAAVRNE